MRDAVDATARWAPSNTNLGIVLLLAPLAKAALLGGRRGRTFARPICAGVLDRATTVDDAREVYAAIRLANPGGLGRASDQDVAREPTQTLRDVMRLAADRDGIAREYDTAFATTFDIGVPALRQARADGLGLGRRDRRDVPDAARGGARHAHRAARRAASAPPTCRAWP